jgi:hypothetical protein
MINNIKALEKLIQSRTVDLTEDKGLYLKIAGELEKTNQNELIKRAEFIRRQCNGEVANKVFDENREAWGIPNFREGLLTADEFRRGFLYKFRDHTTSWSDNQKAKEWFLNSDEARFVQLYEFWICDNGPHEIFMTKTGDYKTILNLLLADADYEVLTSPAFSKEELDNFIRTHQPDHGDFPMEELIEFYISRNPNY